MVGGEQPYAPTQQDRGVKPIYLVPLLVLVLAIELVALVAVIRKFRSGYAALAMVIALFVVNLALFVVAGHFASAPLK
jgi:hypothetical protein